ANAWLPRGRAIGRRSNEFVTNAGRCCAALSSKVLGMGSVERRMHSWRTAVGVAVSAVVSVAVTLPFGAMVPPVSALPAGMPSHFAFGRGPGQGDTWMPSTGIPWDYRMQYLVGGVNTGQGWETWNSNGTFALNYAKEGAQH